MISNFQKPNSLRNFIIGFTAFVAINAYSQTSNFDAGVLSVAPSNRLSQWPLYQTSPVAFEGSLKNFGINNLDSVVITLEVFDENGGNLFSGIQTLYNVDSFAQYSIGNYMPMVTGFYTIKAYTTIPLTTDANLSNDTMYGYFLITDSIYARDYKDFSGIDSTQSYISQPSDETIMGQVFELTLPGQLTAVYFTLVKPLGVGDSLFASVYTTDSLGMPANFITQTETHFLNAIDTSGTSNFLLSFAGAPVVLPAGKFYVGIREMHKLNMATTLRVFTPFTTFNRSAATGFSWKTNEEYQEFQTYVIRPIFGCTISGVTTTSLSLPCGNSTATANTTGNPTGLSYNWSNGATTSTTSILFGGTYTVTVTDQGGCTASATAVIATNIPGISVDSVNIINASCNATANGSVQLLNVSGTAPFSFQWSNGDTNSAIFNLTAGLYSVTITDQNGCTLIQSFNINEPSALTGTVLVQPDNGSGNGAIDFTVIGGTYPYSYLWSSWQTTANLSGLSAATYTVTVTDANGCTYLNSFTVPTSSAISMLNAGINKLQINPNPSDGAFNLSFDLMKEGNVSVSIIDLNGNEVFKAEIKDTKSVNRNLKLTGESNGVYLLRISTSSGITSSKLVIE